jgi:hypothetical protein
LDENDFLEDDCAFTKFEDATDKGNPLYEYNIRQLNTKVNIRACHTLVEYLLHYDDPRIANLYEVTAASNGEGDNSDIYEGLPCGSKPQTSTIALVEVMDRNVGKVLQAISESGQADNTIIIFTTDNGGVYDISRQWPLRAGKGAFYEGGIRVPLIIYQPHRFEKKNIMDVAVSQMDLFPTIMDWAGISDQLLLDGKSLMTLLENGTDPELEKRPLYWHFPAYLEGGNKETMDMDFRTRPVSVILKEDWKLIENYEDGRIELYNLKTDLSEKQDISRSYPQKVKELKTLLDNWKKETHAPCHFEKNPYYQPSPEK